MPRIAITGASGFVGSLIIPLLSSSTIDCVLIGRNKDRLSAQFPGYPCYGYDELDKAFCDADAVLHLAVKNNTQPGSASEFHEVNVTLLTQVFKAAEKANISHFIYTSSRHVNAGHNSPYAISKQDADAFLQSQSQSGIHITTFVLPAVYGDDAYAGKLQILYKLPKFLRPFALYCLSQIRPVIHAKQIASMIISILKDGPTGSTHIYM